MRRLGLVVCLALALSLGPVSLAGARPDAGEGALPSSGEVCGFLAGVERFDLPLALNKLLSDGEFELPAAILFAGDLALCDTPKLFDAHNYLLDGLANGLPDFSRFESQLPSLLPSLARSPSLQLSSIALPWVSLAAEDVNEDGQIPLTVKWLQVGDVGAVDLRVWVDERTATQSGPFLAGGLVGSELLGIDVAPGHTYQVCISIAGSGRWSCGSTFRVSLDTLEGEEIDAALDSGRTASIPVYGSQIGVLVRSSPGGAFLWIGGYGAVASSFDFSFDRPFIAWAQSDLAEGAHILDAEGRGYGASGGGAVVGVVSVSDCLGGAASFC